MRKLLIVLLLASASVQAGYLIREEVVGNQRFCYYQSGSQVQVITVHQSDPCPNSIPD